MGVSHLAWAAAYGLDRLVEEELERGADIDRSENGYGLYSGTALMFACQNGRMKTVELLLRHGASVNLVTSDGKTALEMACVHGQGKCAQMLLRAGADPNLGAEAPLVWAIGYHDIELIRALIKAGVVLNPAPRMQDGRESYDHMPILVAIRSGRVELVEALLNGGAECKGAIRGMALNIINEASAQAGRNTSGEGVMIARSGDWNQIRARLNRQISGPLTNVGRK